MHKVWINSKECRLYEGAPPWFIGNEHGVESKNKDIKQNHTFRRRLQLGEFIDVLANLGTEWSGEVNEILESSRLSGLHGQKDSLSLKTAGYQSFKSNKSGSDKILRINPRNYYTVTGSQEFLLGQVTSMWAVNSFLGPSLAEVCCKEPRRE